MSTFSSPPSPPGGGSYTSSGVGSPAIYSTADIVVSDAIMIYQSQSGDAASGTSSFSMTGGTLNNYKGHLFHVTNTAAVISLNGVTINDSGDGVLLSVCDDGWSGVSNVATLNANGQDLTGDILVGSAIESVDASARTKTVRIFANSLDNMINGGSVKDIVHGAEGNDSILGNAGNDSLYGSAGKDKLYGGNGSDKLYGGDGKDYLSGGTGNDKLYGQSGDDYLHGGDGADTFYYAKGDGKDVIYGFSDEDSLTLDGLDFTGSYHSSTGALVVKVSGGSVTFRDFDAQTFHINGASYSISGNKLVAK